MANVSLLQSAGSGAAVPAGYVGETRVATFSDVAAPGAAVIINLGTLSLPAGTWMIFGKITFVSTVSTAGSDLYLAAGINLVSATETGTTLQVGQIANISTFRSVATTTVTSLTSTTTVYLTARHGATTTGGATISGTNGTNSASNFYAVRIA